MINTVKGYVYGVYIGKQYVDNRLTGLCSSSRTVYLCKVLLYVNICNMLMHRKPHHCESRPNHVIH